MGMIRATDDIEMGKLNVYDRTTIEYDTRREVIKFLKLFADLLNETGKSFCYYSDKKGASLKYPL